MVLRDVVDRKLALLSSYVTYLEEMGSATPEAFARDYRLSGAARYYLQVAIECCVDIGAHIIASDTAARAESYRAIFTVLGDQGIVAPEIAAAMIPAAALRKRLVHGYEQVDDHRVRDMLPAAAVTLQQFAQAIAQYLARTDR